MDDAPRRCNKFARSNFLCLERGGEGVNDNRGRDKIKTVIVHSVARDRSVSSESRKSVYGARYRPSYSLLNPRTLPYIYICIYIYFGLDSNNAGFDLARCMCALEKLHKLEEWILAKKSVRFC